MSLYNFAAVVLAMASAAQCAPSVPGADTAKWLLYDFRRPTPNNAEFEKYHYGAVYENRESTCPQCTVSVSSSADPEGGHANLRFAMMPGIDRDQNAGVLFPIDPWWTSGNDLRDLRQIRFKARVIHPSSYPRGGLEPYAYEIGVGVSLDGPALPFASAGYHPVKYVGVDSSGEGVWKTIDVSTLRYSGWVLGREGSMVTVFRPDADGNLVRSRVELDRSARRGRLLNADSIGAQDFDNDSVNILKHVRAIKFSVEAHGNDLGFTNKLELQIDSIMLVGVAPSWPSVHGNSCHGRSALLDDFSATKTDRSRNLLGGAWWAASDTDTFRPQSPATGKSSIRSNGDVWSPSPESGAASLVADLDRVDADAHPDAGWASLLTSVPSGALEKLKAISMKFHTGGDDPFPFDTSRIMGVVFRAIGPNFVDSLGYEARIPYRQIRSTPEDSSICLDLSELRQPAWYTGIHGIKPVSPNDILRFSWSLVLQDPSAKTASTSRIDLKEVRLWGMEPTSSIRSTFRTHREIGIRHRDGIRLSYSVPGSRAQVRVVRMDGSTVFEFSAPTTVSDMPLPAKLHRGTYAIEVVGSTERRSGRFAVP